MLFNHDFFQTKPTHVMMPDRTLSVSYIVIDIAIKEDVLDQMFPNLFINDT